MDFSQWRIKKVHFQQTHNQSLRQLFLTVSWDLCAQRDTPDGVLVSLQFWKQCMRWSWEPFKGIVPAQKALHGSKTEMRGRTKENIFTTRGPWFAPQADQCYLKKKETEKNWVSGQTWPKPVVGARGNPREGFAHGVLGKATLLLRGQAGTADHRK